MGNYNFETPKEIMNKPIVKVFLSLPMTGKTKEMIFSDIEKMKKYVYHLPFFKHCNIEFVHGYRENNESSVFNLGESIKLMSGCPYVVFHPLWEFSTECCFEHDICALYEGFSTVDIEDTEWEEL